MVEPVGVASGLITLVSFAFEGSIALYETIKSFQSHQQRVSDLMNELSALGVVLDSLKETINATPGTDFSALEFPLRRCGSACKDFEKLILKCSSRSGTRTSFRDWAKLKYIGDDIDGFRRSLAGYKLTISIALTDAHLRKSTANSESLEAYNNLLNTAKADLEDRLERLDDKLQHVIVENVTDSGSGESEVVLMKEERLSTVKCLQICTQLSDHISQIQLSTNRNRSHSNETDVDTLSQKITSEGLQECKDSLARTAKRLEGHERQIFDRLMVRAKTAKISEEDREEIVRLRDELETTRQSRDICSRAHNHLKTNVSTIENFAVGDAVQFMVSTNDKTLHGKNQGHGWRTRQVGGHISDESLQQIAQSLTSMTVPAVGTRDLSSSGENQSIPHDDVGSGKEFDSKFNEQYGRGFKLTPHQTDRSPLSGTGSADGGVNKTPSI